MATTMQSSPARMTPLQKCALFLLAPLLLSLAPASLCLGGESVPSAILESFQQFSQGWMARLEQVSQQNSRTVKPEVAADGRVIGRYICYGPDCATEVRSTNSTVTPFVGIIRYPQKTMVKEGSSAQRLHEEQGIVAHAVNVTEIFRYTGGRWVY